MCDEKIEDGMDFEFNKLNDRELYQFYLDHEDDEELCERIEKIDRFIKYTEKNNYTVWRRTQEWYRKGFNGQDGFATNKAFNSITSTTDQIEILHEAQKSFDGEAERLNIKDEDDVVRLVKEMRQKGNASHSG